MLYDEMKSFFILPTIILYAPFTFGSTYHHSICSTDDFPIKKLSDTDVCLSENFGKTHNVIVDPDLNVDMTSFIQNPTKGQRLILVPRNSDLTIRLDDNVAYQLRQRQQLHNRNSDEDFMDVPLQMNGYTVLKQLSQEIIHQYDNNHTIIDRKINEKQFSNDDSVPLLLKSHPGQALVPLQSDLIGGGYMLEQLDYMEIGIGPEHDAIRIKLREPRVTSRNRDIHSDDIFRYALVNTDGLVLFVSSSQLKVGSPVTLTSWLNSDDDTEEIDITVSHFVTNFEYRYPFIINKDGSLSPLEASHLAIGISRFPSVTLMERFSPDRLIFQSAESFWNAPAPVNGTALVLKSHPGLAIVTYPHYRGAFGLINVMDVLVGPANNDTYRTLHLFPRDNMKHHEFNLLDARGAYLVPMNLDVNLDVPLRMIQYNVSNSKATTVVLSILLLTERNATWIVNLEGSISPLNAPHLVLGCKYISDFVDRDFATKQRLTWQSKAIMDDTNNKNGVQSTMIGSENRSIHGIVWFLIVEGYIRYIALIVAVVAIAIIKVVPSSIWTMLIIQLILGTTASTFYAGFQVGSFLTKAMFKRLKKHNGQEVVNVR